jgi:hypothetical protein
MGRSSGEAALEIWSSAATYVRCHGRPDSYGCGAWAMKLGGPAPCPAQLHLKLADSGAIVCLRKASVQALNNPNGRTQRTEATNSPYRPAQPRPRSQLNQDDARRRGRTAGIAPEGERRTRILPRCPRSRKRAVSRERRREWSREWDSAGARHRNPLWYRQRRRNPV